MVPRAVAVAPLRVAEPPVQRQLALPMEVPELLAVHETLLPWFT